MRKAHLSSCLVLAAWACVWVFQAPAGAKEPVFHPTGQWRIFPRAPFTRPADEEITARLIRQIDQLVALFQPDETTVPGKTLGDSLVAANARNQLFRLEGILRLYSRAFPDLDDYRLEVKEVEDGLGAYSFAVDSVNFARDRFKQENQAQAPDAARKAQQEQVLEGLAKKEETARAVLAKLLERSTLDSDLPELRALVRSTFVGWGASRDLAYVNRELQRMLENVRQGRFNFNLLEDGIHEFRRQLRWIPISIDSLDGLVMVRDDAAGACPVPALEALRGTRFARHRYANPPLRFPATRPCTVSRCLLWQVAKTVSDIGDIKDEAQANSAIESALSDDEIDVPSSNKVTPEETARATAMRAELYSSRALDSLMTQLSSCKP